MQSGGPASPKDAAKAAKLWQLYWLDPVESLPAAGQLAVMVGLTGFWQWVGVAFTGIGSDMWNGLARRDSKLFWKTVTRNRLNKANGQFARHRTCSRGLIWKMAR